MSWLLTERLAHIMPAGLAKAVRPGEGFELLAAGAPAAWRTVGPTCGVRETCPVRRTRRKNRDGTCGPYAEPADEFTWSLEQIDGPLRARQTLQSGRDGAASWGRYETSIENRGGEPVQLSSIYPLLLRLSGVDGPWRILRSRGGASENFYPPRAFSQARRLVYGGEVRLHSEQEGYSSDNHLPLLIACPDGLNCGFFCGMEFSSGWEIALRHVGNRPFLRGQVLDSPVELPPGGQLILPAVHLGFFEGDLDAGAAALRRYLQQHVLPAPPQRWREGWPPVSWCNFPGLASDSDLLRPQIELAAEVGAEAAIIRAGKGEGATAKGETPEISKLRPLLDGARRHGLAAGLWLDIERLSSAARPRSATGHESGSAEHALEFASRFVSELELDYLVLDTRRPPEALDDPSIAYVQVLYRILEALRERFPDLLIENAAAGGRRIDLGTLRRCHLHWLSDETHNPHISRFHLLRAGLLLPSDRLVTALVAADRPGRKYSSVDVLSRFAGCLRLSGDLAALPSEFRAELAGLIQQYKRLRPLLAGEFHPLFDQPRDEEDPDGCIFRRGDAASGPGPQEMKLIYHMPDDEATVEENG